MDAILCPSGHSFLVGVPKTYTILFMLSISVYPGNKGFIVYNSMMMQAKAKISTGEL